MQQQVKGKQGWDENKQKHTEASKMGWFHTVPLFNQQKWAHVNLNAYIAIYRNILVTTQTEKELFVQKIEFLFLDG